MTVPHPHHHHHHFHPHHLIHTSHVPPPPTHTKPLPTDEIEKLKQDINSFRYDVVNRFDLLEEMQARTHQALTGEEEEEMVCGADSRRKSNKRSGKRKGSSDSNSDKSTAQCPNPNGDQQK